MLPPSQGFKKILSFIATHLAKDKPFVAQILGMEFLQLDEFLGAKSPQKKRRHRRLHSLATRTN